MESLASHPISVTPSASAQSEYTRFRACDECRRRKIKCDGRVSGCRHCLNSATPCVYNNTTRKSRKRAASSPKSASDSETTVNLEERLERIERAVREHLTKRLSAVTQDAKDLGTDPADPALDDASEIDEGRSRPTNPNPLKSKQRALYLWKVTNEESIGVDGGLISDFQGKLKFIGESSVFSVFLPRGMQWICEKIGEPNFCDPLSPTAVMEWNQIPLQDCRVDVSTDYHSCASFFEGGEAPLPSRHLMRKYIDDYFDRINYALPIFNRERFYAELGMFYQNGSRASPAWLLAFYVIMALGCISNPLEEPAAVRAENETQALAFFRTGCRNLPTLLFCNRDISGVQGLLVTVLYLWETKSTEGCFTLLGVVASIGSEIGLHRSGAHLGFGPQEIKLRQNLFWIAYILDKDMSLRIGRPSSIADDDVTVRLPQGNVDSSWVLYQRARLAKVVSKVSSLLCSQVSTTLPDDALLGTIKMLDEQLEEWKNGCEIMHKDESTFGNGDPMMALSSIRLKLAYFTCLGAIKRPLNPAFDMQDEENPGDHGLSEGFETCLYAARASINLIDHFEQHNLKMLRSTAIYLVAATVTLFTNIINYPLSEATTKDLRYMKRTSEYLKAALQKGCPGISEMFYLTYTLYSMASQTVARFQMGADNPGNGGNEDSAKSKDKVVYRIYRNFCPGEQ